MSVRNNVVYDPEEVGEVADLIGCASTELKTVCNSSLVKPWAKFKPQYVQAQYDTYDAVLTEDMRRKGNWGFEFTTYRNITTLKPGQADPTTFAWRRKNSQWGRLLDFDGYNHDATSFLPFLPDSNIIVYGASNNISIDVGRFPTIATNDVLKSSDFFFLDGNTSFSQGYLGIILKLSDRSEYIYATNSSPGVMGGLSIPAITGLYGNLLTQNITALGWLFLSKRNIAGGIDTTVDEFVGLNQKVAANLTFKRVDNATGLSAPAAAHVFALNQLRVSYHITFSNGTGSTITFSNGIDVYLHRSPNYRDTSYNGKVNVIKQESVASLTCPPYSATSTTDKFFTDCYISLDDRTLYVTVIGMASNGNTYQSTGMVVMPADNDIPVVS